MTTPYNGNCNLYEFNYIEKKTKCDVNQFYLDTNGKLCRDIGEDCKGIFFKNINEACVFQNKRKKAKRNKRRNSVAKEA